MQDCDCRCYIDRRHDLVSSSVSLRYRMYAWSHWFICPTAAFRFKHLMLLLTSRVIASIVCYCWNCEWLLAAHVVTDSACYCWHHILLLASRVIAGIVCYCWHCVLLLALCAIAGIVHDCWQCVLLIDFMLLLLAS